MRLPESRLVGCAVAVDNILLTRDLLEGGYDKDELRRLGRNGTLTHLRRGAWTRPAPDPASTLEDRHRLLTGAVAAQVRPGAVVSHVSAATLHGLPVWKDQLDRVHLTRNRSTGAKRRSDVEVHSALLPPQHVELLDGVPVTSLARTVADLGRSLPFEQAVAAGDRAAALGLDFGDLEVVLESMQRWPGVCQARRVANFLDSRSESVGESVSRVRIAEEGLPSPIPQREIFDLDGVLIGRVDFVWERYRTIGEFDGKIKYGDLLKPGQTAADVLFAEKLREDALRDAGWRIVRWIWATSTARRSCGTACCGPSSVPAERRAAAVGAAAPRLTRPPAAHLFPDLHFTPLRATTLPLAQGQGAPWRYKVALVEGVGGGRGQTAARSRWVRMSSTVSSGVWALESSQ